MRVTVKVRPKAGVLDPQGAAVRDALRHLGFDVDDVRVGRLLDLEVANGDVEAARDAAERMCEQLLANALIETYEVEVTA